MTQKSLPRSVAILLIIGAIWGQYTNAQDMLHPIDSLDNFKPYRNFSLRGSADTVLMDSTVYYQGDPSGTVWERDQKEIYFYDSQHRITEIQYLAWDNVQNEWVYDFRELYVSYDNYGNNIEYIEQFWDGTQWVNDIRITVEYSSQFPDRMTRRVEYNWDNGTQQWIYSLQVVYNRDNQGNITEYLVQTWDNVSNTWINDSRLLSTYDANGNMTKYERQVWNTGTSSWEPQWRYLYAYDSNNREVERTYETYDVVSSAWVPNTRYNFTYDLSGNLTERVRQLWNSGTSSWDNSSRDVYTYNSQNLRILWESFDWIGGAWEPTFRREYQYDDDGNRTYYLLQSWNGASWDNEQQYFYVYSNGLRIFYQRQTWDAINGVWQNDMQRLYNYDADGRITFELRQLWNSTTDAWRNAYRAFYSYDSLGYQTQFYSESWNTADDRWNKSSRRDHFYRYPLIQNIEYVNPLSEITVFPNPATNIIYVQSNSSEQIELIQIRDATGRLIYQEPVYDSWYQLDVSDLPVGQYLIEIYSGTTRTIKKITKK